MRFLSLLTVLCSLTSLAALEIGAPAPSLAGVTLVKGEPIQPLDGGRLSIVEFWATWCGPCLTTIPHLTQLQKAHPELQIIGISDEDEATVKPFVADQGATMDYRVGFADAATYKAWMEGVSGIPHAVLVNGDGVVLWTGHPMAMEPVLAAALAGRLDLDVLKKTGAAEKDLERALSGRSPDLPRAKAAIATLLALDPVHERGIRLRLAIAKHEEDPEAVRAALIEVPVEQLGAALANGLAWDQAIETDLVYRHLDVAFTLVHRAMALEPEHASYVDTHARLLYAVGLIDQAIAEQERACALELGEPRLRDTLAAYRAAQTLARQLAAPATAPAPAAGVVP